MLVYLMADDERRHEEQPVISRVVANIYVCLVQRDELPFLGLLRLDELGPD